LVLWLDNRCWLIVIRLRHREERSDLFLLFYSKFNSKQSAVIFSFFFASTVSPRKVDGKKEKDNYCAKFKGNIKYTDTLRLNSLAGSQSGISSIAFTAILSNSSWNHDWKLWTNLL
jgi:hypothetical protein